jgi:hypothetical protein
LTLARQSETSRTLWQHRDPVLQRTLAQRLAELIQRQRQFSAKVTSEHPAKLAYVYVHQSSVAQVTRNSESTELQHQLVERAAALGWSRENIKVIDEDLGKFGASAADREEFQRLIAETGLAKVGLVVSLDTSRVARNNRDWYQLLELCSLFGTLIADSERLYDPGLYQDRMMLGRSSFWHWADWVGTWEMFCQALY